MSNMTNIMKLHGAEYLEKFGATMPLNHKKVIHAISNCRQGYYGYSDFKCKCCGKCKRLLNCCGNRHCPSCQTDKNQKWLAKQMDKLLPTHYFMMTFTLPEETRAVVRANQKLCYGFMFEASSETLRELSSNPKFIGCDTPGFFGVLHTWGRQLPYHPHIHYIVPGGGLKNGEWVSSKANYYVCVQAASRMFRGKFMALLKEAGLADQVDKVVWDKKWNINSKAVGDGQSSLKYLAPYVHRVALADSRIKSYNKEQVIFTYKKSHSRRLRPVKLKPMEFLHRFLQHTLPDGFMKIRYYGFMNPNCRYKIQEIREKICILQEVIKFMIDETPGDKIRKAMKPFSCVSCGGLMELIEYNFRQCSPDVLDALPASSLKVLGAPPDNDRSIAC